MRSNRREKQLTLKFTHIYHVIFILIDEILLSMDTSAFKEKIKWYI